MRQEPNILAEATEEFITVVRWVLSGFIQAFFIICWVIIQWAVNEYVIVRFRVTGIDERVLIIAQLLFAIATISPIVFFLIQLLITMALRTWRFIRKEFSNQPPFPKKLSLLTLFAD